MTKTDSLPANLNDQTVLRILNHLTADLREDLPDEQQSAVQSQEEAREAIVSFLETYGASAGEHERRALSEEALGAPQARILLKLLLEDEATRAKAMGLLEHPPDDEQRSIELAVAGAVILGATITWLLTKVEIKVNRRNQKTEFQFHLSKPAVSKDLVQKVAQAISSLLVKS